MGSGSIGEIRGGGGGTGFRHPSATGSAAAACVDLAMRAITIAPPAAVRFVRVHRRRLRHKVKAHADGLRSWAAIFPAALRCTMIVRWAFRLQARRSAKIRRALRLTIQALRN